MSVTKLRFRRQAFVALVLSLLAQAAIAAPSRVTDVRLWSGPEGTRLVLELSGPVKHEVFTLDHPDRIVVDLDNAELATRKGLPSGQGPVTSVRSGPQPGHGLRFVLDLSGPQTPKSFAVGPDGSAGNRVVIEIPSAQSAPPVAPTGNQVLAAG